MLDIRSKVEYYIDVFDEVRMNGSSLLQNIFSTGVHPEKVGSLKIDVEKMNIEDCIRLTSRYNSEMSTGEQIALQGQNGLDIIGVTVYTNDSASGAINTGHGRNRFGFINIVCLPAIPVGKILSRLYPGEPSRRVNVCGNCIYRSWYEFSGTGTEVPENLLAYIKASYAADVNPLPEVRKKGYLAEMVSARKVRLQKGGHDPITIEL